MQSKHHIKKHLPNSSDWFFRRLWLPRLIYLYFQIFRNEGLDMNKEITLSHKRISEKNPEKSIVRSSDRKKVIQKQTL